MEEFDPAGGGGGGVAAAAVVAVVVALPSSISLKKIIFQNAIKMWVQWRYLLMSFFLLSKYVYSFSIFFALTLNLTKYYS